jgi:hypothetical protein
MTNLQLQRLLLLPTSTLLPLVVLLIVPSQLLLLEPRFEECGWIEMLLRIADDLRGAYPGWFVDGLRIVSEQLEFVGSRTLQYRRRLHRLTLDGSKPF